MAISLADFIELNQVTPLKELFEVCRISQINRFITVIMFVVLVTDGGQAVSSATTNTALAFERG